MKKITIVGISDVSASIGLCLRKAGIKNTEIVGTSASRKILRQAKDLGVIDVADTDESSAVKGSGLIILDLPLSETQDFLESVGTKISSGAVVTDLLPVKSKIQEWAKNNLPENVSFIGGHPLVNHNQSSHDSINLISLDEIDYVLVPSINSSESALNTVVRMVETLGAKPLFMDAFEHDSYSLGVALLPQLTSFASVSSASNSPGWNDISKFAGEYFQQMATLASNDPEHVMDLVKQNPAVTTVWLQKIIDVLLKYKENIDKSNFEELFDDLINSWEDRAKWEQGVEDSPNKNDIPAVKTTMTSMLVGGRIAEKMSKMESAQEKPKWKYFKRSKK
ncbi:MAG: prephenate dehydrogenase [SAR202 cluster bacterium]|nr:prephenate dehydrogenase [SAR202 cluster bacterium]